MVGTVSLAYYSSTTAVGTISYFFVFSRRDGFLLTASLFCDRRQDFREMNNCQNVVIISTRWIQAYAQQRRRSTEETSTKKVRMRLVGK